MLVPEKELPSTWWFCRSFDLNVTFKLLQLHEFFRWMIVLSSSVTTCLLRWTMVGNFWNWMLDIGLLFDRNQVIISFENSNSEKMRKPRCSEQHLHFSGRMNRLLPVRSDPTVDFCAVWPSKVMLSNDCRCDDLASIHDTWNSSPEQCSKWKWLHRILSKRQLFGKMVTSRRTNVL